MTHQPPFIKIGAAFFNPLHIVSIEPFTTGEIRVVTTSSVPGGAHFSMSAKMEAEPGLPSVTQTLQEAGLLP